MHQLRVRLRARAYEKPSRHYESQNFPPIGACPEIFCISKAQNALLTFGGRAPMHGQSPPQPTVAAAGAQGLAEASPVQHIAPAGTIHIRQKDEIPFLQKYDVIPMVHSEN